MKTIEELNQNIKDLIDERQELQLKIDDLYEDNERLRQRVTALEHEQINIKAKLRQRSRTAPRPVQLTVRDDKPVLSDKEKFQAGLNRSK